MSWEKWPYFFRETYYFYFPQGRHLEALVVLMMWRWPKPPQVKMEREHVIPKRKRSPKNDPTTQPEMVEVIDDIMEVEVDMILTWPLHAIGKQYFGWRKNLPLKLLVFEDNSITLHHVDFDPWAKKLYIGRVRVKGKNLLENNYTSLDIKEFGNGRIPLVTWCY
jgi:hypothetical protein